jgi:TonB family protein
MTNISISLNILGGAEYLIIVIIIAVLAIPFLYLATLFNTIKLTNPNKRTISPWTIWLYLIPIVGFFIHYNHINRINETLEEEFKDRGIKQHDSQFGYTAGRVFSLTNILLFFVNIFYTIYFWVSINEMNESSSYYYETINEKYSKFFASSDTELFGVFFIIASLTAFICWIIYWSKISNCKKIMLNHNSQTFQHKNSFRQETSKIVNSINKDNSLQNNVSNILTGSAQILNSTSNNYQRIKSDNQTKQCPDCKSHTSFDDNFCMKCGFDFAKYEAMQQKRLKENEKECPECNLILNKNHASCTNCGFPFPLNSIPVFITEPAIILNEVKNNIISEPIIENTNTKPPIIESSKSETIKSDTISNKVEKKKSHKIYFIVFGIILLLIGIFVFYKIGFSGLTSEELAAREKQKSDSLAAVLQFNQQRIDDSLNNAGYESEMDSNQEEITPIDIMNEIHTKIYKYYEDIQLDRIDAIDYFAPNVSQYITKKNLTPEDINNSISKGKEEFSKPEIVLDINNIVNTRTENEIRYFSFQIHFKCYRISKQKTQECDVTVEIGVNQSKEFVSIKETKIENLKFYDEDLNITNQELSSTKTSNEIYSTVEEMPQFPGGAMEMMKYIQNNIQYPQMAKEAGLSGKCYLKFIVTADGSIKDIQILKGVPGCKECDTEATRVVSSMPNWKAGKQDGRAVNVYFNLPINFQLR